MQYGVARPLAQYSHTQVPRVCRRILSRAAPCTDAQPIRHTLFAIRGSIDIIAARPASGIWGGLIRTSHHPVFLAMNSSCGLLFKGERMVYQQGRLHHLTEPGTSTSAPNRGERLNDFQCI